MDDELSPLKSVVHYKLRHYVCLACIPVCSFSIFTFFLVKEEVGSAAWTLLLSCRLEWSRGEWLTLVDVRLCEKRICRGLTRANL